MNLISFVIHETVGLFGDTLKPKRFSKPAPDLLPLAGFCLSPT
jgi:hypothetical protein